MCITPVVKQGELVGMPGVITFARIELNEDLIKYCMTLNTIN